MKENVLSAERKVNILTEALPFIQGFHGKTFVIHCSGDVLTDTALQLEFGCDIALLQSVGIHLVIVHGGALQITQMLKRMGIYSVFHNSIRVTDAATMEVVDMVLGKLNQDVVGLINQQGGRAVGLCGQDGLFIYAKKLVLPAEGEMRGTIDLGLVGEIERIDPEIIKLYHTRNFVPVVVPIGVGEEGESYNLDAATVAARLAEVLQAEKLISLTDLPGILDQNGKLISSITVNEIEGLFASGGLSEAIHKKIGAALEAVRHGVRSVHVVDGRCPNALLLELLTSEGSGTLIRSDAGPHFFADSLRYLRANVIEDFDGPAFTFDEDGPR